MEETVSFGNIIGEGILRPCLNHQFRVLFGIGATELTNLTKQVLSFKYDMVCRKGHIVFELPLCGNGVESCLYAFNSSLTNSITLEYLDGMFDTPGHSVQFFGIKPYICAVSHDYITSNAVHIELSFEYDSCSTTKQQDGKEVEIIE